MTKPDDEEVLKKFYKNVRPWGFWEPIHQKVLQDDPAFEKNTNFNRDMINVAVGIVWQVTLCVIPIYIVVRKFNQLTVAVAVLAATSLFLKINWYNKLEEN